MDHGYPDPVPEADPADAPRRDLRWLVIGVLVAIPVLVLIAALAQRTWYPTGDQAQAELRMLSLPGRPPLVGAAGRIADEQGRQGNHPGPLMFWATWPLYVVLGRSSWAFEAATALVNLAWLTLSVWLVKRRAGLAACAWYGATALVLIGGYGLDGLSQPWNPWVSLLPFTVLLLATWSVLEGDRWAPVLAVAAASYALQGHVGYLPVTVPLVGLCLVVPIWRWWRRYRSAHAAVESDLASDPDHDPRLPGVRSWLIPLLVAIDVGIVLWLGPIWDVVTNSPSNLSKIIANFANPTEPPIGIGHGIEAVLQSVDPLGPWVWGGAKVAGSIIPGLLFLVVWAGVAVAVALRRAAPSLTRLNAVLAVVGALGVIAVSRVFGQLYLYTFRWIVAIVALQVFTLGWGIVALLPRPSPEWNRRFAAVGAVALALLAVVTSVRLVRQEIPYDQSWRAEQVLAPKVAGQLDPDQRYLVVWDDPAYLGGLGFGMILDLERRGFTVGGQPQFDAAIEPHRVMCRGDFDAVITVVTGEQNIAAHRADPNLTEIAATDPRSDPEAWERTAQELVDVLNERKPADEPPDTVATLEKKLNLLLLAPGQPQEVTDLASDLVLGGVPSAVFTGAAPESVDLSSTRSSHPCPAPS